MYEISGYLAPGYLLPAMFIFPNLPMDINREIWSYILEEHINRAMSIRFGVLIQLMARTNNIKFSLDNYSGYNIDLINYEYRQLFEQSRSFRVNIKNGRVIPNNGYTSIEADFHYLVKKCRKYIRHAP